MYIYIYIPIIVGVGFQKVEFVNVGGLPHPLGASRCLSVPQDEGKGDADCQKECGMDSFGGEDSLGDQVMICFDLFCSATFFF